MARYEMESKNVLTKPIINPKVDRILVFVFSFLGTFAGIILKSATDWSYGWIIFTVFASAIVLVIFLKLGRWLWLKAKSEEKTG